MSIGAVQVHPDDLRSCGDRLADCGYRVASGLREVPPLVVTAPTWAAAAALTELERAADTGLGAAGAALAATASALREAADGYAAADRRAAGRLAGGW
jgi:hypothetical protein